MHSTINLKSKSSFFPLIHTFTSSTSASNTFAVDFAPQCTLIGNQSGVVVYGPSSSSACEKQHFFATSSFQPSQELQGKRLIGYGAIANHATAAFTEVAHPSSGVSIVSIDPLAVATTPSKTTEEIREQGCQPYRILHIKRLMMPVSNISNNNNEQDAIAMNLLLFSPIGNVSAILVAEKQTSSSSSSPPSDGHVDNNNNTVDDDDDAASAAGNVFVGIIKNVPALLGEQSSQVASIDTVPSCLIDWHPVAVSGLASPGSASFASGVVVVLRKSKNVVTFLLENSREFLTIEQNGFTDKIASVEVGTAESRGLSAPSFLSIETSDAASGTALQVQLVKDEFRPVPEECCFCMMELFPQEGSSPDDVEAAVLVLSCGHGYHRACLQQDLVRVDDFVKDGRYFRFRRLGCSTCSSSMRDALRFSVLEHTFAMRKQIEGIAKALDVKIGGGSAAAAAPGGGDDDAEPLDDRLKRHLFYVCNTCKGPFYGGPYDCGATLSDPKTKPESLVCDGCCADFSCPVHGRSSVVYKCQNCWNVALKDKRFLGRLRLCASCFDAQKGKPAPSDEMTPFVSAAASATSSCAAAPEGTPFASLGKTGWAVCGHDAHGNGLSVAGCRACHPDRIPSAADDGKEKSPDAAQ